MTSIEQDKEKEEKKDTNSEPESLKLFIGGLSWDVNDENCKEYFEKYGTVVSVNIPKDFNTNTPRGFAFVEFSEKEAYQAVLDKSAKRELIMGNKIVEAKKVLPKSQQVKRTNMRYNMGNLRTGPMYSPYGRMGYDSRPNMPYSNRPYFPPSYGRYNAGPYGPSTNPMPSGQYGYNQSSSYIPPQSYNPASAPNIPNIAPSNSPMPNEYGQNANYSSQSSTVSSYPAPSNYPSQQQSGSLQSQSTQPQANSSYVQQATATSQYSQPPNKQYNQSSQYRVTNPSSNGSQQVRTSYSNSAQPNIKSNAQYPSYQQQTKEATSFPNGGEDNRSQAYTPF